jgi:hypothetical protein
VPAAARAGGTVAARGGTRRATLRARRAHRGCGSAPASGARLHWPVAGRPPRLPGVPAPAEPAPPSLPPPPNTHTPHAPAQGIDKWVQLMKGWPRVLELMVAGKLLTALLPAPVAGPLGRLLGRPFMELAGMTGNELLDGITKARAGGEAFFGAVARYQAILYMLKGGWRVCARPQVAATGGLRLHP